MDCIKDIGCFPSCNSIKFPYVALETGVHYLIFEWLNTRKRVPFEAVEGEVFYIPNYFNEGSDPIFSIQLPSGSFMCWDSELEQIAICPDDCGKDCAFIRHFTAEINQTSGLPKDDHIDPDFEYSNKIYNIDSAEDNGDGTFSISVIGAEEGDLAVDDNGTFYEYEDGTWTVKFKEVCAFQDVDTLPENGEECVLYIADGKYWKFGETYCDYQNPVIIFQPYFNSFEELPNPGDPSYTYVVENSPTDVELYVWVDGAYQPVYFDGVGDYPTEWEEGQYVYVIEGNDQKIVVGCLSYADISPLQDNLFTKDLTLTESRTHEVGSNLFKIKGAGFNPIAFEKTNVNNTRRGYFEVRDSNATLRTLNPTQGTERATIQAIYRDTGDPSVEISPNQDIQNALNSGQLFLKLQNEHGKVLYSKILSDDIDDTTSVQKFVTQGEKNDIANSTLNTDTDVSGNDWVLDEDDMISDSDTKVPTQQSVKAYVDANAGGSPVNLFTDDLTLGENRSHDLDGNRIEFKNGGSLRMTNVDLRFTNGDVIYNNSWYLLNNSNAIFAIEDARFAAYVNTPFRAGIQSEPGLVQLWDGKDQSTNNNKINVVLQRVSSSSTAEWHPFTIPEYADDAAADADATLVSGAPYSTVAGGRAVFRKP